MNFGVAQLYGWYSRNAELAAEDLFRFSSLHPDMGSTICKLAPLAPRTLALMHGPSFAGDTAAALEALADDYDRRTTAWRDRQAAAA